MWVPFLLKHVGLTVSIYLKKINRSSTQRYEMSRTYAVLVLCVYCVCILIFIRAQLLLVEESN